MRYLIGSTGLVVACIIWISPVVAPDTLAGTARAEVPREEINEIIAAIDRVVKYSPNYGRLLSSGTPNMDQARADLEAFRSEMQAEITQDLIAKANDPSERRLVSLKASANRFAEGYQRDLAAADLDRAKEYGRSGPIFMRYMSFVAAREKLALLRKVYGDTPEIAAATAASDSAFAKLGDFAAVESQAADVTQARIARNRLEPAIRSDAALGQQFARAFENSFLNTEKAKVLKVNLISSGWSVERNEITGIILLRYQYASLGLKGSDGTCYSAQARFEQKHQGGGSYGSTYYRSGGPAEMLCENI
uniref:hypothetical protein n=1 Tax=Parerythrobacter lutipelagi TaxID=1964208 RepID=UPI0010F6F4F4|nr:hypothetical protein [Parerythrobacter lutipelagi]